MVHFSIIRVKLEQISPEVFSAFWVIGIFKLVTVCMYVCMYVCKILEESPVRWAGPNAPITTHKESHGGGSNRVSYTPVTG